MNREIFAQRVRDYGAAAFLAARGEVSIKGRSAKYEAVLEAFDALVSDRDTLAAGMMDAFDLLPHRNEWGNPDKIDKAIEVVDRLNGEASGGASPRLSRSSAAPAKPEPAQPEPTDDYDLVVVTNNKTDAWRYRRGRVLGETTLLISPLGWHPAEPTRTSWYGIKPGYRMFGSWVEAEKWIAGDTPDHPEPAQPAAQPAGKPKANIVRRNRIANLPALAGDGAGDNIGIALATYFEAHQNRPEDDPVDTEVGWGDWVIEKTNDALDRAVEELAKEASNG